MHQIPTNEQAARWFAAAPRRHSRRAFAPTPASAEQLAALTELAESLRPWPDARIALVAEPAVDVFRGVIGAYGKVTGAPHLLAVIAEESDARDTAHAHAGYIGEAAVLEAASLGLDTCWVGGFFDPARVGAVVPTSGGERVIAVSPVGFATQELSASEKTMRAMAGAHKRLPLEKIAPGAAGAGARDGAWPAWALAAAECVRLAPSAVNRQPWRLRMEGGALIVARDSAIEMPKVTRALDCGIAMLHAELGARDAGASGTWTDLAGGLDVARFDVGAADDSGEGGS